MSNGAGVVETRNVGNSTPTNSSAIATEDNIFINDVKIGPSVLLLLIIKRCD